MIKSPKRGILPLFESLGYRVMKARDYERLAECWKTRSGSSLGARACSEFGTRTDSPPARRSRCNTGRPRRSRTRGRSSADRPGAIRRCAVQPDPEAAADALEFLVAAAASALCSSEVHH